MLLGLALVSGGQAWGDIPSCPKKIKVAENPSAIPPGFRPFTNGNPPSADVSAVTTLELNSIQFSNGPPTEIAWLAPDNEDRGFEVWHFAPSAGKQIWLSCGYTDTKLILSAPLPAEIKSCRVTYDPGVQGYPATGMTCK